MSSSPARAPARRPRGTVCCMMCSSFYTNQDSRGGLRSEEYAENKPAWLPSRVQQARQEKETHQNQDDSSDAREERCGATDATQERTGAIHQETNQHKRHALT